MRDGQPFFPNAVVRFGVADWEQSVVNRAWGYMQKDALEGTDDVAVASHFPGLTFGRVLRGNGKRYWA